MTMFGLKEAEVATLVRAVAGDDLDHEAIRDRFARATWTGIAEPGDRMAGLVVEALGAATALDAIVDKWPLDRWLGAIGSGSEVESAAEVAGSDRIVSVDGFEQAIARWQPRLNSAAAILALGQAARFGARLFTPSTELWPSGVDDLGLHAPLALWVRGTDAALESLETSISLVGARAATAYGEHVTMEASAGLVDRGFAIVSGAAYGIDGMAHRAALASHGMTIAFLAGGVDRFYPSGHDALLSRIVIAGAVISELPCGQPPTRWRFLQRNRLIAAASQATIVLEAGWRSGSLNTAGHAGDLSRPLGAVPGPVTSAASAGCHRLIRDYNAILVTTADEMAELAPNAPSRAGAGAGRATGAAPGSGSPVLFESSATPFGRVNLTSEQTRLLDAMSYTARRQPSDLAARAGMSVAEVQSVLGRLELEGLAIEDERGWARPKKIDPGARPPKLN